MAFNRCDIERLRASILCNSLAIRRALGSKSLINLFKISRVCHLVPHLCLADKLWVFFPKMQRNFFFFYFCYNLYALLKLCFWHPISSAYQNTISRMLSTECLAIHTLLREVELGNRHLGVTSYCNYTV